jgi:hypothetical protein
MRFASWRARLEALNLRDRHALRVGGLVIAAAVGFRAVLLPYVHVRTGLHEQVARERDLLQREQALLVEAKTYGARFQSAERTLLGEAPRLFAGPDLVAATGSLSTYVGDRALRSRVFVQQSETREPEVAAEGVARIRVELRAVGDLEGLLSFLESLELGGEGDKLVVVERLAVTPAERIVVTEPIDEQVLGISASVAGYVLAEPDPETGGAP